jgi:hypothetical protein
MSRARGAEARNRSWWSGPAFWWQRSNRPVGAGCRWVCPCLAYMYFGLTTKFYYFLKTCRNYYHIILHTIRDWGSYRVGKWRSSRSRGNRNRRETWSDTVEWACRPRRSADRPASYSERISRNTYNSFGIWIYSYELHSRYSREQIFILSIQIYTIFESKYPCKLDGTCLGLS